MEAISRAEWERSVTLIYGKDWRDIIGPENQHRIEGKWWLTHLGRGLGGDGGGIPVLRPELPEGGMAITQEIRAFCSELENIGVWGEGFSEYEYKVHRIRASLEILAATGSILHGGVMLPALPEVEEQCQNAIVAAAGTARLENLEPLLDAVALVGILEVIRVAIEVGQRIRLNGSQAKVLSYLQVVCAELSVSISDVLAG